MYFYTKSRPDALGLRDCRNCKRAKRHQVASKRPKPTPSRRRMRPKQPKPMPSGRRMHPKRPNPMPACRLIGPKRSNFNNSGSIWGSLFVVFRCNNVRAIRLSMRSAEPRFLSTGAELQRVCRLCENTENRQKLIENRSNDALRTNSTKKIRFFRSWTRLGMDFGRRSSANLTSQGRRNRRSRANLLSKGPRTCHSRANLTSQDPRNHIFGGNLTSQGARNRRSGANLTSQGP